MTLAERCAVHAAKMDEEGWYVTANALWRASQALSGATVPELPVVHSYMRVEANRLRLDAADTSKDAGYREAARRCASLIAAGLREHPDE